MKNNVNKIVLNINSIRNHNWYDPVIAVLIITGIVFAIAILPIYIAVTDKPMYWVAFCFIPPILCYLIGYIIRTIIIRKFYIVKDISGKVEKKQIDTKDKLAKVEKDTIYLFAYQGEYMIVFLYNWLYSLGVLKNDKLKLEVYDFELYNFPFVGVNIKDLDISKNEQQFKKEFKECLTLEIFQKMTKVKTK